MDPSTDIDLNRFRLNGKPKNRIGRSAPARRSGGWFVKGPIPGCWLGVAASLPGKALHVALVIWHIGQVSRSRSVKLEDKYLRLFGVGRRSANRALQKLEQAGLVELDSGNGRRTVVTIRTENCGET